MTNPQDQKRLEELYDIAWDLDTQIKEARDELRACEDPDEEEEIKDHIDYLLGELDKCEDEIYLLETTLDDTDEVS